MVRLIYNYTLSLELKIIKNGSNEFDKNYIILSLIVPNNMV